MKLLIAGSRSLNADKLYSMLDINTLLDIFNLDWPLEFVHGGCPKGTDEYCDRVANSYHDTTKLRIFKADWKKHGKSAGPKRNKQMAEYADVLLLIWDGQSRGSKNMKEEMLKLNKPIYEIIIREHP